jgi:hypothetical protein
MRFGKIFDSVFTGSLFGSGPTVFAVWSYVIANAEPPGTVELNPALLAACIGTGVDEINRALEFLTSPDPESRNQDEEGRRLIKIRAFTYFVVSFEAYREKCKPTQATLDMEGYVYFAGVPGGDRVKIGFSKNPWARLSSLRVVNREFEILATEKATMAKESDRHRQFAAHHIEGEWFQPAQEILDLIDELGVRVEITKNKWHRSGYTNYSPTSRPEPKQRTFLPLPSAAKSPVGSSDVEDLIATPDYDRSTTVATVVIEKEIEVEKEKVKDNTSSSELAVPTPRGMRVEYQKVVDLYHECLPTLPRCLILSEARKRAINARWREVADNARAPPDVALKAFRDLFTVVSRSDFLMGKKTKFVASLDWLMKADNFAKVVEGRYDNTR